jgi:hypothetical protein
VKPSPEAEPNGVIGKGPVVVKRRDSSIAANRDCHANQHRTGRVLAADTKAQSMNSMQRADWFNDTIDAATARC